MRVSAWFIAGLGCIFLFGFLVLGVSLYRLQTEKAGEFAEVETSQTTRRISVPALRGRILDRSGPVLADCRPSRCIVCNLEELQQRGGRSNTVNAIDAAVDALSGAVGVPRAITREQIARHVARASALPLTAWRDLDEKSFARFAERADMFPGFALSVRAERRYPYGTLAAHVIGYTGRGRPGEDPSAAPADAASAENQRIAAENTRKSQETARQNAETARASAETARANAETQRNLAELDRIEAELERISKELERKAAEAQRQQNEEVRHNGTFRQNTESGKWERLNQRTGEWEDTGNYWLGGLIAYRFYTDPATGRIHVVKNNTDRVNFRLENGRLKGMYVD